MERQPPPRSPLKTMERQSLKEPFSLVHENNMRRSNIATGTEPRGPKYNPYNRHEPNRIPSSPDVDVNNNQKNDGAVALGRAKSSTRMRAPETTRSIDHQRPRPISTGRIITSSSPHQTTTGREVQDAHAVTMAILDLRERREQSHSARRQLKQHPLHSHRNQSTNIQQERPQSPRLVNKGDEKASFKLKEAENRIGTLLQELEELRFFHEIDMEPAAIVPTKSIAGVPRANESPGRRQQLLSPRRLASLDRTALELEAQELQRQVEILMQEKTALQSKVQLQEHQSKSHSDDANRIQKLETALSSIRVTLNEQIHEIQHGRSQLSEEYDAKLKAAKDQYNEAQQDAETLAEELESQKEKLDRLEEEYAQFREQTKEQLTQLQKKWGEKESAFERQMAESMGQVESLHTMLDDREEDNVRLQKELTRNSLELETCRRELKEQCESSAGQLEQSLRERDVKYETLNAHCHAIEAEAEIRAQRIVALEASNLANAEKADSLERQLAEIEESHKQNVEALKRTFDSREQRRLDDLVQSQHSKVMEYEERIADTRKQLELATDRHQAEIEHKEIEMKASLEQAVHEAKLSLRSEYEAKLSALREELDVSLKKYDTVRQETVRFQVQSAGKDRDVAREWERRDALRQGEMERLNDKLDIAVGDLAEKESKVQSLTDRLAESEQRCQSLLGDLESQHSEEIKAREDILMQRKAVAKLKTDLARKDFEIAEIREDMERTLEIMQGQLELAKKEREQAILKDKSFEDENKNRLATMTQTLERVQKDLISERARHESLESELRVEIAKFEGKLSATESTLKEKRLIIDNLEARLLNADELSSSAGGKLQATIASLKRELESCTEALAHQQLIVQQKDKEIVGLTQDIEAANKSNGLRISGLQEMLLATQQKLQDAENIKAEHEAEALRIREEHQKAVFSLRSVSTDREEVSMEVQRVQNELRKSIDLYETKLNTLQRLLGEKDMETKDLEEDIAALKETVKKMSQEENTLRESLTRMQQEYKNATLAKEELLRAREDEVQGLQDEIKEVKMQLQQVNDESATLSTDAAGLQQSILDLEAQLAAAKVSTSNQQSGSELAVAALQQKLKEKEVREEEMAEQMDRIANERAEAIEGLEQMIEEVQLRQEEFDQLADILEKREEELENAKIIATKALASAQEIKTRYKQRGYRESDKQTDLQLRIDELNAEVEYLTGKTDDLRKKSMRLEAELREKNIQCAKLRDELREQETKSTQSSSTPASADKEGFMPVDGGEDTQSDTRGGKLNDFMNVREEGVGGSQFMLMESGFSFQESDTVNTSNISDTLVHDSMSTQTADLGDATKWLHDFEDGKSIFSDGATSEPGPKSSRSAERDKVRNFVRKRYLKRNSSKDTQAAL